MRNYKYDLFSFVFVIKRMTDIFPVWRKKTDKSVKAWLNLQPSNIKQ